MLEILLTKKSVTCLNRQFKKKHSKKVKRAPWLSGTSCYFNRTIRQKDISLLLTDLPSRLMDVFTIAFGREQRHLRENPFCVIYHCVTTTPQALMSCLCVFSALHLCSLITFYRPLKKKPESVLPRWRLCWLLKWCGWFLALSPHY